jgi:hypothetical protein
MLADHYSPLHSYLRVSDLFMVRRTCKSAWKRITHSTLTKANVVKVALGAGRPDWRSAHVPLLRWCAANDAVFGMSSWKEIGATGDAVVIGECLALVPVGGLLKVLEGAASAGHGRLALDLMRHLSPTDQGELQEDEMRTAVATGGVLEVAQQIDADPSTWHGTTLQRALAHGHLLFVQWALADTEPIPVSQYVSCAVSSGNMELVEWLVGRGWPIDEAAYGAAARSGSLAMLEWVKARAVAPTPNAVSEAVKGGHLHVIEWLVSHGSELTAGDLCVAAYEQDQVVVDWLLDRDCPYSPKQLTLWSCSNKGGSDLFFWLLDRGIECDADMCMREAFRNPAFDVALIHQRLGTPLHEHYIRKAAYASDIDQVRYGLGVGAKVCQTALSTMIRKGDSAMLDLVLGHPSLASLEPTRVHNLLRRALTWVLEMPAEIKKVFIDHGFTITAKQRGFWESVVGTGLSFELVPDQSAVSTR